MTELHVIELLEPVDARCAACGTMFTALRGRRGRAPMFCAGAECRRRRRVEYWKRYREKQQAPTRGCRGCGAPCPRPAHGGRRSWCSDACKARWFRRQRKAARLGTAGCNVAPVLADALVAIADGQPNLSDEQRLRLRIADRRDEVRYAVDEVFDLEAQLQYAPQKICPGCGQEAPPQSVR